MTNRICLAGLAAAISIAAVAGGAKAATTDPLFIPGDHDMQQRRAGGHYSIVVANLARRCTDLITQFNQAIAQDTGSARARGAMPDYREGVALCDGGNRLQGIDTLEAALKEIGAIPRITY